MRGALPRTGLPEKMASAWLTETQRTGRSYSGGHLRGESSRERRLGKPQGGDVRKEAGRAAGPDQARNGMLYPTGKGGPLETLSRRAEQSVQVVQRDPWDGWGKKIREGQLEAGQTLTGLPCLSRWKRRKEGAVKCNQILIKQPQVTSSFKPPSHLPLPGNQQRKRLQAAVTTPRASPSR